MVHASRIEGWQDDVSMLFDVLELTSEEIPWVSEDFERIEFLPWLLLRQDDNGQVFPVRRFRSRTVAENVAREFEAKGHKQSAMCNFF